MNDLLENAGSNKMESARFKPRIAKIAYSPCQTGNDPEKYGAYRESFQGVRDPFNLLVFWITFIPLYPAYTFDSII
jgi:hypothetical protein